MSSLLDDDPSVMALSPIEMIEHFDRISMSKPRPNLLRADEILSLHEMLENNDPLSKIVLKANLLTLIYENDVDISQIANRLRLEHEREKFSKRHGECCTICMQEYEINERIWTLDCRHEFHTDCISKWVLCKNECPLCRATRLKVIAKSH
ncbi:E3 ubiquitin protein ligase MBR1-like protein [Tanacetum coccineum]